MDIKICNQCDWLISGQPQCDWLITNYTVYIIKECLLVTLCASNPNVEEDVKTAVISEQTDGSGKFNYIGYDFFNLLYFSNNISELSTSYMKQALPSW